jgi:hypothetical protein
LPAPPPDHPIFSGIILKSFITGDYWYDVETSEEDLSLTFLTVFAIARTEQTFYD